LEVVAFLKRSESRSNARALATCTVAKAWGFTNGRQIPYGWFARDYF